MLYINLYSFAVYFYYEALFYRGMGIRISSPQAVIFHVVSSDSVGFIVSITYSPKWFSFGSSLSLLVGPILIGNPQSRNSDSSLRDQVGSYYFISCDVYNSEIFIFNKFVQLFLNLNFH